MKDSIQKEGPVLLRHSAAEDSESRRAHSRLGLAPLVLLLVGILSLGYYAYTVASQDAYESYANWAFDHSIAGGSSAHWVDYLRQDTPVGWIIGRGDAVPSAPVRKSATAGSQAPRPGMVLGRITVPRLHIEAMVREGVSSAILSQAVGHVPATALAGQEGNFAIAAHRDTLFRGLKDIQKGDLVLFRAWDGEYTYRIVSMRIVKPTEVSVLRPDGALPAGTLQSVSYSPGAHKLITLITCYPFYYVGSAPERFIVQGQLVAQTAPAAQPGLQARTKSGVHGTAVRETAQLQRGRAPRKWSGM